MSIVNTVRDLTHRVHCAHKRRKLIAELYNLNDRQLQDIGLLRGDIPDTAMEALARHGCPTRNHCQP